MFKSQCISVYIIKVTIRENHIFFMHTNYPVKLFYSFDTYIIHNFMLRENIKTGFGNSHQILSKLRAWNVTDEKNKKEK